MVNIILLFWSRQTNRSKWFIFITTLLVSVIFYLCARDVIETYKDRKFLKSFVLKETERANNAEFKIDSLLTTQIIVTKDVQKKSNSIKTKLKQDVKEINNSTISNKQLFELLAKYD